MRFIRQYVSDRVYAQHTFQVIVYFSMVYNIHTNKSRRQRFKLNKNKHRSRSITCNDPIQQQQQCIIPNTQAVFEETENLYELNQLTLNTPYDSLKKFYQAIPWYSHHRKRVQKIWQSMSKSTHDRVIENIYYVLNPILLQQFEEQLLASSFSSSTCIWAIHGSSQWCLESICEHGFRLPGDPEYRRTRGWYYGRGIYVSDALTKYSLNYADSDREVLLCRVMVGNAYSCNHSVPGPLELVTGYDSHRVEHFNIRVIFNRECVLPMYRIQFKTGGDATLASYATQWCNCSGSIILNCVLIILTIFWIILHQYENFD